MQRCEQWIALRQVSLFDCCRGTEGDESYIMLHKFPFGMWIFLESGREARHCELTGGLARKGEAIPRRQRAQRQVRHTCSWLCDFGVRISLGGDCFVSSFRLRRKHFVAMT